MSRVSAALFLLTAIAWEDASAAPAGCRGSASYTAWFEATWSAETHPDSFPASPHFSGLVGATHLDAASFWQEGTLATRGIESMAELGQKGDLIAEVEQAIADGVAEAVISGPGIPQSPGVRNVKIEVSRDFPLVTIVTMVAPSPDWFVGVAGLELCIESEWADKLIVDLHPWDAGTDSGATYNSADKNTRPPAPISKITSPPLGNGVALGRFVFWKTAETIFADDFESGDTSRW